MSHQPMKQNSADILHNIFNILNNAVVFHSTMVMGSDKFVFFLHAVQCSADHLRLATYTLHWIASKYIQGTPFLKEFSGPL